MFHLNKLARTAHIFIIIGAIVNINFAADTYTPRGGRLAGNDILNGSFTYMGAAQMCSNISACAGFSWIDNRNNATFEDKKWVRFKPSIALVLAHSSRSAIKNYPAHGPNKLATVFQFERDKFPDGSVIPCVGGSSLITTASGVLLAFAICRCVNIKLIYVLCTVMSPCHGHHGHNERALVHMYYMFSIFALFYRYKITPYFPFSSSETTRGMAATWPQPTTAGPQSAMEESNICAREHRMMAAIIGRV